MKVMKTAAITTACICIGFLAVFVAWLALYPQKSDPKNLYYVAWKWGFPTMDPEAACENMIGDRNTEDLVMGKTVEQVRKRFVHLRENDFLFYQQAALERVKKASGKGSFEGKKIVFLGNTYWIVVFKNGRASDLIISSKG